MSKTTKDVWVGTQALEDEYPVDKPTPGPTQASTMTTVY